MPGIAGMGVMSTTFSALAMNLTFLREQGVLKRMRGTPLPGRRLPRRRRSATRSTNALIQIAIVVVAGSSFFGIGWPKDWLELVVFVVAGVVCLAALGVAWSHVIPNFDAAPAYMNIVFLPVIFISGVFYDVDNAPQFLRDIAQALPLVHVIDGLSAAMVTGDGRRRPRSATSPSSRVWTVVGHRLRGARLQLGRSALSCGPTTRERRRRLALDADRDLRQPPAAHSSRSIPKTLTSRWRSPWRCQRRSTPSWRKPTPSSARVERSLAGLE